MTNFLTNAVAFIVLISILVAVHEYGHYIVGRWMGMKVLRYSIGFGKPIWTRVGKKDQTEYCVSSIPLGGYVRFLDSREGIVEPEDEGRAFDQRPIPARIAVLLAGPVFNFLLAIVAFWVLLPPGDYQVQKPVVGEVTPGSFAEHAGMQYGDIITAVGDVDVAEWEPTLHAFLTDLVADGRVPLFLESTDGRRRQIVLDVGEEKTRLTEPNQHSDLFDTLGFQIWRRPAVVGQFIEPSVAREAGMIDGDQIVSINGNAIRNFRHLAEVVTTLAGQEAKIGYLRAGDPLSVTLTVGTDADNESVGRLGIVPPPLPESYYSIQSLSFASSFSAAVAKTQGATAFTLTMLGRMVTGDVSIKNISGPINIAQIAGESVERGWRYFVRILALISISLGVLNLLPVPILDGGQIVYQLIEALKGGPMTERAQILGQQIGILALLLLMSFAFYNDIARIIG